MVLLVNYACFFEVLIYYLVEITVFEDVKARPGDKRKREELGDPADIESYKGRK